MNLNVKPCSRHLHCIKRIHAFDFLSLKATFITMHINIFARLIFQLTTDAMAQGYTR